MSSFGDYRLYRQYQPEYSAWKTERDTQNAKRLEYLKQHPELKNSQDIQRARSLLRAVDIMDEYSQKRAEDMEVATETVVGYGLDFALLVGTGLGYFLSKLKPVESVLLKLVKPILSAVKLKSVGQENAKMMAVNIAGTVLGGILATLASFPLQKQRLQHQEKVVLRQ